MFKNFIQFQLRVRVAIQRFLESLTAEFAKGFRRNKSLQIFVDGSRQVSDKEIWAAISKAKSDYIPYRNIFEKPFKNSVSKLKIPSEYRDHLLGKGKGTEEVDLWEASPVRLFDAPEKDTEFLFRTLYELDDYLFIGTQYDTKVRTIAQWIDLFKKHPTLLPYICPNPVDGQLHRTKSGTLSYRCDEAVCKFRFAVLEFDTLSRNWQFAF